MGKLASPYLLKRDAKISPITQGPITEKLPTRKHSRKGPANCNAHSTQPEPYEYRAEVGAPTWWQEPPSSYQEHRDVEGARRAKEEWVSAGPKPHGRAWRPAVCRRLHSDFSAARAFPVTSLRVFPHEDWWLLGVLLVLRSDNCWVNDLMNKTAGLQMHAL